MSNFMHVHVSVQENVEIVKCMHVHEFPLWSFVFQCDLLSKSLHKYFLH